MPDKEEPKHSDYSEGTIFEWNSSGRPFKKRGRQFYLTSLLIMLLVEVILFLFSQYILMFVVMSLVFVSFAMEYIPPREFHYRISSEGIQIENGFFLWKELYDFYFKKRGDMETLHIRTESYFPGELIITFRHEDKEKIKKALLHFLDFREYVESTFVEKAGDWLSRNFPLENK